MTNKKLEDIPCKRRTKELSNTISICIATRFSHFKSMNSHENILIYIPYDEKITIWLHIYSCNRLYYNSLPRIISMYISIGHKMFDGSMSWQTNIT